MNSVTLVEKIKALPHDKQVEVLDFVDYLVSRFSRHNEAEANETEIAPWSEQDFSVLSASQALRGMESEPDLYTHTDLKEHWN